MGSKVVKFLRDRDMYGYAVGVNYKGDNSFRTRIGAIFTLVTYSLIILNLVVMTQGYLDFSK